MTPTPRSLARLVAEIRACRICADILEPNPVVRVGAAAKLLIAGQAPGLRVHKSGLPFNDASGDRLRAWLGLDSDTFYDQSRVAIAAMAFCFPGYDAKGGDRPPPRVCAQHWRARLLAEGPEALAALRAVHPTLDEAPWLQRIAAARTERARTGATGAAARELFRALREVLE